MNSGKTLILLVIMTIAFGGLSFNSVAKTHGDFDGNQTNETTPTPTSVDENTTPSVTPTPEISETPTPTPTNTPQGGTSDNRSDGRSDGRSSTPQVVTTTYAKTGNALVNLILGLGLSLLTFGGVTYAKRNIS